MRKTLQLIQILVIILIVRVPVQSGAAAIESKRRIRQNHRGVQKGV